jgi:hypothetical protein
MRYAIGGCRLTLHLLSRRSYFRSKTALCYVLLWKCLQRWHCRSRSQVWIQSSFNNFKEYLKYYYCISCFFFILAIDLLLSTYLGMYSTVKLTSYYNPCRPLIPRDWCHLFSSFVSMSSKILFQFSSVLVLIPFHSIPWPGL